MINLSSNDQGITYISGTFTPVKCGNDSNLRTRFTWSTGSALHLVVCDSFWERQPSSTWNRVAASSGLHRGSEEDEDLRSNHIMTMASHRKLETFVFNTLAGRLGRKPSQAPHVPSVSVWDLSPEEDNTPPGEVDVDIKIQVHAVHLWKRAEPVPSSKELFQLSLKAAGKHGGRKWTGLASENGQLFFLHQDLVNHHPALSRGCHQLW